jgi:streptothricin acetyltransferase
MTVIDIRPLQTIDLEQMREIIVGHTSTEKYSVRQTVTENEIKFSLKLKTLETPFCQTWQPTGEDAAAYRKACAEGTCLAAYEGDLMVGVVIGESRRWNQSFYIWEFHVRPSHHRRGIGWLMMEEMISLARKHNLRVLVCETQNTNVPAIRFYQAMDFTMDGIDLSYYTNEDYENDMVAVYMKRKIV